MEHQFRVNDQIIIRRPILHGRGSNLIKVGTILAFADNGQKAIVSFPADSTRLTLKISELEPVKAKYARDRVQISPVRRSIGSLMY
jgi:hypothetical protein